jgi:hypothetical protein
MIVILFLISVWIFLIRPKKDIKQMEFQLPVSDLPCPNYFFLSRYTALSYSSQRQPCVNLRCHKEPNPSSCLELQKKKFTSDLVKKSRTLRLILKQENFDCDEELLSEFIPTSDIVSDYISQYINYKGLQLLLAFTDNSTCRRSMKRLDQIFSSYCNSCSPEHSQITRSIDSLYDDLIEVMRNEKIPLWLFNSEVSLHDEALIALVNHKFITEFEYSEILSENAKKMIHQILMQDYSQL